MPTINQIHIFSTMSALLPLLATCILLTNTFSLATAQSLVPGIHGMSIVQGVKFTWVIISSDNEISVNLRYLGNSTGTGNRYYTRSNASRHGIDESNSGVPNQRR